MNFFLGPPSSILFLLSVAAVAAGCWFAHHGHPLPAVLCLALFAVFLWRGMG
jgi:hypothetical protein